MSESSRAQSAVTAELLMVAIAVIVTATLAVVAFGIASDATDPGPTADVQITAADGQIRFLHRGGDAIPTSDLQVTLDPASGSGTRRPFTASPVATFEAGKELSLPSPAPDTRIRVILSHEPSGAVLAREEVAITATAAQLAGSAGDLDGDGVAATDQDGDGDFEDIDGDGDVDGDDWYALFVDGYLYGSGTADLYDFNGDGEFDYLDLYSYYFGELVP